MTRYPETETRRTLLASAAAGMRQRDAAGTAGLLRSLAPHMFNVLIVASWFCAVARPAVNEIRQTDFHFLETSCGSAAARFRLAAIASGLCELPVKTSPRTARGH
jgi:hypothetical protein